MTSLGDVESVRILHASTNSVDLTLEILNVDQDRHSFAYIELQDVQIVITGDD